MVVRQDYDRKHCVLKTETMKNLLIITGTLSLNVPFLSQQRSSAVRTLIGDEKISEIDSVVASGSKTCAAVYPADRCPWSPRTFKKIAYNAILVSNLDLGSVMAFAAKSFAS